MMRSDGKTEFDEQTTESCSNITILVYFENVVRTKLLFILVLICTTSKLNTLMVVLTLEAGLV